MGEIVEVLEIVIRFGINLAFFLFVRRQVKRLYWSVREIRVSEREAKADKAMEIAEKTLYNRLPDLSREEKELMTKFAHLEQHVRRREDHEIWERQLRDHLTYRAGRAIPISYEQYQAQMQLFDQQRDAARQMQAQSWNQINALMARNHALNMLGLLQQQQNSKRLNEKE